MWPPLRQIKIRQWRRSALASVLLKRVVCWAQTLANVLDGTHIPGHFIGFASRGAWFGESSGRVAHESARSGPIRFGSGKGAKAAGIAAIARRITRRRIGEGRTRERQRCRHDGRQRNQRNVSFHHRAPFFRLPAHICSDHAPGSNDSSSRSCRYPRMSEDTSGYPGRETHPPASSDGTASFCPREARRPRTPGRGYARPGPAHPRRYLLATGVVSKGKGGASPLG